MDYITTEELEGSSIRDMKIKHARKIRLLPKFQEGRQIKHYNATKQH